MKPTIGRIVHVRLTDVDAGVRHDVERWRPAIITAVLFNEWAVSLYVFLDFWQDRCLLSQTVNIPSGMLGIMQGSVMHLGSVREGEEVENWRWPPKEE